MPIVIVEEQKLFYAHHKNADESGPALVLLHGAGGSRLFWPAELRRLPVANVYVLDLPGHGRSSKPARQNIDDYANVLDAFIKTLSMQNVVVIGHSMGGAIAQSLALRQPQQLHGLVLLATGAQLPVSHAILDGIKHDFRAAVDTINAYSWDPETPSEVLDAGRHMLSQNDPDVLYSDFLACDTFDVRERLSEIRVPVLVVSGTKDRMTPLKYGRYLAAHLPQAQLVVAEGSGHMMALEKPRIIAAAVERFLQKGGPGKD